MIEYVKGQVAELTPAIAVIECHGVGYCLNISLNTYSALQGKQEAKLYVYEAIREDAYTPDDKKILFRKLPQDSAEVRRQTFSSYINKAEQKDHNQTLNHIDKKGGFPVNAPLHAPQFPGNGDQAVADNHKKICLQKSLAPFPERMLMYGKVAL